MLRLAEFTSNEGDALLLYLSIVTESTHPDHLRLETEPKNVEALERLPPMLPQLSHFLPGGQTNFDGANELGRVIRVNASGCRGIKSLQHAMQVRRSLFCGALAKALTQSFRTLRPGEEPFQQRAEI